MKITLLLLCALYCTLQLGSGEVTFGSCPDKCECGQDEDDDLPTIDCSGAEYDYIPVTSIPCGTKRLIFKNNRLKKISRMSFIGLRDLEEIDVSGNFIVDMETESFAGMPNLRRVNLADNKIKTLDARTFRKSTFDLITMALDGNGFYCDEDLKENINEIKHKVKLNGLVCAGGEIWRVRGVVRGRSYEDVESQIRKNFESWEIALITISAFIAVAIPVIIAVIVWLLKRDDYQTGESKDMRNDNLRTSRLSYMSNTEDDEAPKTDSRRIEMSSDDPYNQNNHEDDDIIGGRRGAPYSDSGDEAPNDTST